MPKVRMTRTERASRDGLHVEEFVVGQEYDVPDSLILAFATMGAIETPENIAVGDIETPEVNPFAAPQPERTDKQRRGRKPKA